MSKAMINIPSLPLHTNSQHFLLGCPRLQQSHVLVPSVLTGFSSNHVSELEQACRSKSEPCKVVAKSQDLLCSLLLDTRDSCLCPRVGGMALAGLPPFVGTLRLEL